MEIVNEPFKKIAIDIVGELPRTTTGYKYILTIVDYATRYPEAIPSRTTNAKTVAEALIQYFSRVSIPDEIVSDQGSNFMSKLLAQLYQERSQDFSKGGSQTGTPSGDRRLYMVYTGALPRVSAGSVVLSRHEGPY